MDVNLFKFETQDELIIVKRRLELSYPNLMVTATKYDSSVLAVERTNSLVYDLRISSIIRSAGGTPV